FTPEFYIIDYNTILGSSIDHIFCKIRLLIYLLADKYQKNITEREKEEIEKAAIKLSSHNLFTNVIKEILSGLNSIGSDRYLEWQKYLPNVVHLSLLKCGIESLWYKNIETPVLSSFMNIYSRLPHIDEKEISSFSLVPSLFSIKTLLSHAIYTADIRLVTNDIIN
ncbi:MAG: hypothetical protein HQK51_21665, partial [Oligoflexia bacterium]|nr:hypothetical protein [Oligoflexia bacterium]